jgi:hypothetical protein
MELINKEDTRILNKVLSFISSKFRQNTDYEMLKNYFDDMEISVEQIDNI